MIMSAAPASTARSTRLRWSRNADFDWLIRPAESPWCPGFLRLDRSGINFASHYLVPLQRSDFVRGKSELGQNLLGLLAELRRPRRHLARGARERDRLTDQTDVAVLGVW